MRLILIVLIALTSYMVYAQDAGLYEAEDIETFAYVGEGWAQVIDGDYVVMESSQIGDSVSLDFNGSSIILYRSLHAVSGSTVEACIDESCATFTNAATINMARVPIAYVVSGTSPHSLTLTNLDGNIFQLDNVLIMPDDELHQIASPDPSKYFFALDSGRVVAIDFTISGGDIATIIFIVFLSVIMFAVFVTVRANA